MPKIGEIDGGDVTLTKDDIIRDRADKVADKAIDKAANEGKSGSEARKEASEARSRFMSKAKGMGGGGGGGMKPDTDITASKKLPKMKKGGTVSSASKRADGIAQRGKTKGRII